MNLNKALSHLGFKPEDYIIEGNDFVMVPKFETKQLSHAVYDENSELISEATFEEIDVTPAKPTQEELQTAYEEVQLKEVDIALLINEYLKDKEVDPENDSINIADGLIFRWEYANIPQPSNQELLDLISIVNDKKNQDEINENALKYLAETDYKVLRHIRQKALQQSTTLSEEDYLQLEQLRSQKAESIIN